MKKITKNTLVSLSIQTEDQSGNLLAESEELIYLHGSYGQIFQKLEESLEGKMLGDRFNLFLTPAEAFGEYDESLVTKEPLDELPEDIALGMEIEAEDEETIWVVETIEDGYATLNANHEFAGIPVRVSGEVLELQQLSDKEVEDVLNMEHTH
ncbi:MAG: peptidylprolyl isomerase [Campylobacterales bacterium]|nr:peptidylprolyl isomerase [Campylobacterales bacterium]